MKIKFFETERLILRKWRHSDLEPYYQINQDPKVIEFLRGPLTREECQNFINETNRRIDENGYGLWAVELKENQKLLGFVGLNSPDFTAHFTPCVEVGWRLASQYWGRGYASEAAKLALEIGFKKFNLPEIVSFTVPQNIRSQAVMKKIGMIRDLKGDFLHPKLTFDHRLSHHILYKKSFC